MPTAGQMSETERNIIDIASAYNSLQWSILSRVGKLSEKITLALSNITGTPITLYN